MASIIRSSSTSNSQVDLSRAIEFLPGKLYYLASSTTPKPVDNILFFSIDQELIYWNYCLDFGPLNIGHVFRFHDILQGHLEQARRSNGKVIFYSSSNGQRRANAVCILCCWAMLFQKNVDAKTAYAPFTEMIFPPFHDATDFECTYDLSIRNVLDGLERAIKHNYINAQTFDVDEYQHYEKVENGDLSWVSPKFIAFAGPHAKASNKNGHIMLSPEHYIPYFKKKNVTLVVRLNDKCYDRKRFTDAGIDHLDLYYPDGTNAPLPILKQFLDASEKTPGAVAVHCKAGLGRTGTCIGCYMMKHEKFTAREVIGWLRLTRPGSVIGPQQDFMDDVQDMMHAAAHQEPSTASVAVRTSGEKDDGDSYDYGGKPQHRAGAGSPLKASMKMFLGKHQAPKKATINPQGDYLVAQKQSNSPPQSPVRMSAATSPSKVQVQGFYHAPS